MDSLNPTLPKRIREKLRIKRSSEVTFIVEDGKVIIQPLNKSYFESMAGIAGTDGKMLKSLVEDKKKERG